jgi:YggT family protein
MFIIANLIEAIAKLLSIILELGVLVIIVRVIFFWANADPYNGFVKAIQALSEPLLVPFRKIMPSWKMGGVDLSPLFAILVIELLQWFLIPTLYQIAARL